MTYYGQAPVERRTNPLAIAAFAASLSALAFGVVGSVVGIVLGFMALAEIKSKGEEGKTLATWAIWLGFGIGVGTILLAVVVLVVLVGVFGALAVTLWQTGGYTVA